VGSFSSIEISASGLSAQRMRMDTIASNIANANTTRTAEGGPYTRKMVVFQTAQDEFLPGFSGEAAAVAVPAVLSDPSPAKLVYEPGHPDADARG